MYEPETTELGQPKPPRPRVEVESGRGLTKAQKKRNREEVVRYARRYGYRRYDAINALIRTQGNYWPGAFPRQRKTSRRWGPLAKKRWMKMSEDQLRVAQQRLLAKNTLKRHGFVQEMPGLAGLGGLGQVDPDFMAARFRQTKLLIDGLGVKARQLPGDQAMRWNAEIDVVKGRVLTLEREVRAGSITQEEAGLTFNQISESIAQIRVGMPNVEAGSSAAVIATQVPRFVDMPEDSDFWNWAKQQPTMMWTMATDLARGTNFAANLNQQYVWENKLQNLLATAPNSDEARQAAIHVKAGREAIEAQPGMIDFLIDVAEETRKQVGIGPWGIEWWKIGAGAAVALLAYGAASGAGRKYL